MVEMLDIIDLVVSAQKLTQMVKKNLIMLVMQKYSLP